MYTIEGSVTIYYRVEFESDEPVNLDTLAEDVVEVVRYKTDLPVSVEVDGQDFDLVYESSDGYVENTHDDEDY